MDDWKRKEAETIRYWKSEFIVNAFRTDFPEIQIPMDDIEAHYRLMSRFVSRSEKLFQWLSLQKLKYTELAKLPKYLEGLVNPEDFKKASDPMTSFSDTISEYAKKKKDLSDQYRFDLKKLEDRLKNEISFQTKDNNLVKILTLSSQSLPLPLGSLIEN